MGVVWPAPSQTSVREQVSVRLSQRGSSSFKRTRWLQTRLVFGNAPGKPPDRRRNGAIFEILEAPVVSVEGRKVQGIVFTDPKSNMKLITHELAQQLQIERGLTKIFMKRVNKDYSEREVKVYCLGVEDAKRQIHWMEAVGMESITESVRLHD